jgi:hypothetical protein
LLAAEGDRALDSDVLVLTAIVAVFIGLTVFYLKRNRYIDDETKFSQAGISVNYTEKTIQIKGGSYPASKVRGVRWESGRGNKGNISYAYVQLDDMRSPVHKVKFITPGAAEKFCQRLQVALERTGEISLH